MSDLFDFKAPSRHFAVMGDPVAHSRSPQIHRLFARQFGIPLEYDRIQVDAGGFHQAVSHFAAHGGGGLNITLPFKVEAWKLCAQPGNQLSARAQRAGAVNTLGFDSERGIFGDNTDGVGLVRDIENNLGLEIAGKRVLVLGAGGAVRGILGPLAAREPAALTVANRTAAKASALAEAFGNHAHTSNLRGCGFDKIDGLVCDLIINGTSASLDNALPDIAPNCLGAHSVAYDLMYARRPTRFMEWALANGAGTASDGFGMLVEQAAESFRIWHGPQPDTAPVITALREG